MPTVVFSRETLTLAFLQEALPLLYHHWREVAHDPDIPLDVDTAVYLASEQAGILRVFTMRAPVESYDLNAELVGYACFFVRPAPHYKGSLQAVQDVLYLDPSVRGWNGIKFIKWCDDQLMQEGVQKVFHHTKTYANFGPLLERMGYEAIDVIYGRRLDRAQAADALSAPTADRALAR